MQNGFYIQSQNHNKTIKYCRCKEETIMDACQKCKGESFVIERFKDLGGDIANGSVLIEAYERCSMCDGKGYVTEEDREKWYSSFNFNGPKLQ